MARFLLGIGIPLALLLLFFFVLQYIREFLPRWLQPLLRPSPMRNGTIVLIVALSIVRWWLKR